MQLKFTSQFLAMILCFCKMVSAQQNDSVLIVQLLKDDYATMNTMDTSTHLRNLTSDYRLIEGGEIWDINTELDSIYRGNNDHSIIRSDFFLIKTVKVSGDMAYAIWHLRSEFRENGNLNKELIWNESGIFRKKEGYWKIALIHSSLEPKK